MVKISRSNTRLLIIALVVLAFAVRLAVISNNDVHFFYDQARDAAVSRSIFEKGDIKIQGPSASGSNDILYHGVFYYYLIGLLYTLFGGSPYWVAVALSFLNSLTVIPVFLLAQKITGRTLVGILASFMFAVFGQPVHAGVWISNPALVPIILSVFFYLYWRVVFEQAYNRIPLLFLFLGLANQAFLYTVYLWVAMFVGAVIILRRRKEFPVPSWPVLLGVVFYVLTIATMILTEVRILRSGLFSGRDLQDFSERSLFWADKLKVISRVYYELISLPLLPWDIYQIFAAALFLISLGAFLWYAAKQAKYFVAIIMLSPLVVELLQPRSESHSLLGVSLLVYIVVSFALVTIWQSVAGRIITVALLSVLLYINVQFLLLRKAEGVSIFVIQKEATLRDQLALIDYTYQQANKQPFTFSTYTNPYEINTTWAYLYSWYGKKTYGYVPEFYGANQDGRAGGDLLPQTEKYSDRHFSIYEPFEGLVGGLNNDFSRIQRLQVRPTTARKNFRKLLVEERFK